MKKLQLQGDVFKDFHLYISTFFPHVALMGKGNSGHIQIPMKFDLHELFNLQYHKYKVEVKRNV